MPQIAPPEFDQSVPDEDRLDRFALVQGDSEIWALVQQKVKRYDVLRGDLQQWELKRTGLLNDLAQANEQIQRIKKELTALSGKPGDALESPVEERLTDEAEAVKEEVIEQLQPAATLAPAEAAAPVTPVAPAEPVAAAPVTPTPSAQTETVTTPAITPAQEVAQAPVAAVVSPVTEAPVAAAEPVSTPVEVAAPVIELAASAAMASTVEAEAAVAEIAAKVAENPEAITSSLPETPAATTKVDVFSFGTAAPAVSPAQPESNTSTEAVVATSQTATPPAPEVTQAAAADLAATAVASSAPTNQEAAPVVSAEPVSGTSAPHVAPAEVPAPAVSVAEQAPVAPATVDAGKPTDLPAEVSELQQLYDQADQARRQQDSALKLVALYDGKAADFFAAMCHSHAKSGLSESDARNEAIKDVQTMVTTAKVQLEQLSQGDALQKSKGGGMRRWLSH